MSAGANAAIVSNHWAEGGAGATALAKAVVEICEGTSQFKFLYDLELPIEEKISVIGKQIYGADGIELSGLARQQVETYTRQGYNNLPSKSSNNSLWFMNYSSSVTKSAWLKHSIPSLMIRNSRVFRLVDYVLSGLQVIGFNMLYQVSPCPSVLCACLPVQDSSIQFLATCKRCQVLPHALVSDHSLKSVSLTDAFRILGGRP